MRRVLLLQLIVAAATAISATLPATARDSLTRSIAKTHYGDARVKLKALGYTPIVQKRTLEQCKAENVGREKVCQLWPEVQSCGGTGFARCFFLWRRTKRHIEIRTVGDEREIVDRVRCLSGCR